MPCLSVVRSEVEDPEAHAPGRASRDARRDPDPLPAMFGAREVDDPQGQPEVGTERGTDVGARHPPRSEVTVEVRGGDTGAVGLAGEAAQRVAMPVVDDRARGEAEPK